MPNWCNNNLQVRGTKKNVLDFLNKGLKVLGVQAKDLKEAQELIELYNEYNQKNPLRNANEKFINDNRNGSVRKHKYVPTSFSLECYLPMPDTFHWVDTTNSFYSCYLADTAEYKREKMYYESEKKFQKENYGVVGWYDWCIKNYGTKWNACLELSDMEIEEYDEVTVYFNFDTAWSPCEEWLYAVQEDNKLVRFQMLSEEPGMVYRYEYTSDNFSDNPSEYSESDDVCIYKDDLTSEYEEEMAEEAKEWE